MLKNCNGFKAGDLVTFGTGKPRGVVEGFCYFTGGREDGEEMPGYMAVLRLVEDLIGTCGGRVPKGEVVDIPVAEIRLVN